MLIVRVTNHFFFFEGNGIEGLLGIPVCLRRMSHNFEEGATSSDNIGGDRKASYKEDKEKRLSVRMRYRK